MANFQKGNNKNRSFPGAVILGITVGLLTSIALGSFITVLIQNGYLEESFIQLSAYIAMALGAFIGTLAATAGKEDKLLPLCGSTAAGICLCYLGGGAIVFGSGFKGIGVGVITVLLGSAGVLLLNILSKFKVKNHKRKYRFR